MNLTLLDMMKRCLISLVFFSSCILSKSQSLKSTSDSLCGLKMKNMHFNFTINMGQVADRSGKLRPEVLFTANVKGAEVFLRDGGISYVFSNAYELAKEMKEVKTNNGSSINNFDNPLKGNNLNITGNLKIHQVDMNFLNFNSNYIVEKVSELKEYSSFYLDHCDKGINQVRKYGQIRYKNIYKKIDVQFQGNAMNDLEYDFIVHPGADPNDIQLEWKGGDSMYINKDGMLMIETKVQELKESIPHVFQFINGEIINIDARYKVIKRTKSEFVVGFQLGSYNPDHELIIDPWATYYGGSLDETPLGIATDIYGDIYVTGVTTSPIGISSAGFQNIIGGTIYSDAFLAKFNPSGGLIWSTYYGGTLYELAFGVSTDRHGDIYIAGTTRSNNAIASSGFMNTIGGIEDGFLVKFNSSGARIWGTYYGDINADYAYSVTCDKDMNVYLAGRTQCTVNIANGGFQNTHGGGVIDAYLVKFDSSGNRIWATYYGGTNADIAESIATDEQNNVYLSGQTRSTNSIASGGFQNTFSGGFQYDNFLVKFDSAGSRLWGTYYGGVGLEFKSSVATDTLNNIYLAGGTRSLSDIASIGAFQTNLLGMGDAYLVKFDSAGNRIWATYLGGSNEDYCQSLIVDTLTNDVYISGDTYASLDFPTSSCAWHPTYIGGLEDCFVTHFNPNGQIICSSFIGSNSSQDDDEGKIAIFNCNLYMTGCVEGDSLIVSPGAYQTTYGGGIYDVFVTQFNKLNCDYSKTTNLVVTPNSIQTCINLGIDFTSNFIISCDTSLVHYAWSFPGANTTTSTLQNPSNIVYSSAGTYTVSLTASTLCDTASTTIIVTILPLEFPIFNPINAICKGDFIADLPTTSLNGISGSWSPAINNSQTTVYYFTANVGSCSHSATLSIEVFEIKDFDIISSPNICNNVNGSLSILNVSGSSPPYLYEINNQGFLSSSVFNNLQHGVFTVVVSDSHGCKLSKTAIVEQNEGDAELSLKSVASSCHLLNGLIEVDVSSGGLPPFLFTLSPFTVQNTTGIFNGLLGGTTYTIQVVDGNNCSYSTTLYLVDSICCNDIYIPNAFSPNHDGINDEFLPVFPANAELKEFIIMNRFGEMVFTSKNNLFGWDGTDKGSDADLGVYFYYIRYTCEGDNEEQFLKGDVLLLR